MTTLLKVGFPSKNDSTMWFSKKAGPPQNAKILQGQEAEPQAVRQALREGFQYFFEGRWLTFDWKTSEGDLPKTPGFSHEKGVFGWPVWRLNAPVRLAGLELANRLEIHDSRSNPHSKLRLDVPIDYFGFFVAFGGGGKDNYRVLKNHLAQLFGRPTGGWERADQLHSEWSFEGLKISCLWSDSSQITRTNRDFDEHASLSIWNETRYPEFLTEDYSNNLQISGEGFRMVLFEPQMLQLRDNYRASRSVRLTPKPIAEVLEKSGKTLAVWLDLPNDRIGFARRELAVILRISELRQLNFSTDDCDRHYEDRLRAISKSGEENIVLYAGDGELEGLKNWLLAQGVLEIADLGFRR